MLSACTVKHEDKEAQNATWRTKIVNAFVLRYFCMCGQQKPENPQIELSPMADDTITQGGIGGLGSLVYICSRP